MGCNEILKPDEFKVVGGLFREKVVIKCQSKGHIFEIQPARKTNNLKELKCRQCMKERRAEQSVLKRRNRRSKTESMPKNRRKSSTTVRENTENSKIMLKRPTIT